MTDQEKIQNLRPFNEAQYENVGLDHLIMYVMSQLAKIEADLSFENAVVAAFKVFPKKFSLIGFPSYPDAKRVHDCLFRCTYKAKQWLGGKTAQGFAITDRSKVFIRQAENLLSGLLPHKAKWPSQTRRKELLLAEVVSSPGYKKYTREQRNSITEADVCFLLQGTLDSSREILRENMESFRRLARELKRDDVETFLKWLHYRFKNFLNPERQKGGHDGTRSYSGRS